MNEQDTAKNFVISVTRGFVIMILFCLAVWIGLAWLSSCSKYPNSAIEEPELRYIIERDSTGKAIGVCYPDYEICEEDSNETKN